MNFGRFFCEMEKLKKETKKRIDKENVLIYILGVVRCN